MARQNRIANAARRRDRFALLHLATLQVSQLL
jgi:hypothetical protein